MDLRTGLAAKAEEAAMTLTRWVPTVGAVVLWSFVASLFATHESRVEMASLIAAAFGA